MFGPFKVLRSEPLPILICLLSRVPLFAGDGRPGRMVREVFGNRPDARLALDIVRTADPLADLVELPAKLAEAMLGSD